MRSWNVFPQNTYKAKIKNIHLSHIILHASGTSWDQEKHIAQQFTVISPKHVFT